MQHLLSYAATAGLLAVSLSNVFSVQGVIHTTLADQVTRVKQPVRFDAESRFQIMPSN